MFFEDTEAGEQTERGPLPAVRRTYQQFSVTFKKRTGDAPVHCLREGDASVVEPQVNVLAIDAGFPNLVDLLGIKSDIAQCPIHRQHRTGIDWYDLSNYRWARADETEQRGKCDLPPTNPPERHRNLSTIQVHERH